MPSKRALIVALAIVGLSFTAILLRAILPEMLHSTQRSHQQKVCRTFAAVSDILTIHKVKNGHYPQSNDAAQKEWQYTRLASIIKPIAPEWMSDIPDIDPWGTQYLYGYNASKESYCIISLGKDGLKDQDILPVVYVVTHCFENDIIMVNGKYIQAPEGQQWLCGKKKNK